MPYGYHDLDAAAYARLPEDLLADLLAGTPQIAGEVNDLLGPALQQRDRLREAAEDLDLIATAPIAERGTLCAVDGGFAVERTIAVDIAMAVAVGVEGLAPAGVGCQWTHNQYKSFHRVLLHDLDNERLVRAAMVAHELKVLAAAPHNVRIYDGSHLTPIIQLNSGLTARNKTVNNLVVTVANDVDLLKVFDDFATNPACIAMPKYDSTHALADELSHAIKLPIPGDDKYLTSVILRGGEYTVPRQISGDPWRQLHITPRPGSAAAESGLADDLDEKIEPLRTGKLLYLYWRPTDTSPTYRLEIKPGLAKDTHALGVVFATLADQITGPFVREPYPQYLADVMAKSVGLGLSALRAAAHLSLTHSNPELAPMLVHSYRTEGK
ncbi:Uncharacterised protein [Mycobacteroides abscessus subsp. abscessus]|nr:hypothetical protein D2E80_24405 [Mycobacteroides abscessus]SIB99590.1 Uncharacterised protein [Mycobacteroides abscessus subsp. abscessus]SKT91518.1 Uncharacterised protein [Mycobacteroides abscessus subsp. massiliense]SKU10421.1 Uncharacterised protein [Mycobacteroides abscessus subsp. massiliense]